MVCDISELLKILNRIRVIDFYVKWQWIKSIGSFGFVSSRLNGEPICLFIQNHLRHYKYFSSSNNLVNFKVSFGIPVLHLLKQTEPIRNMAKLGIYILINVRICINKNFGGGIVLIDSFFL